MSTWTRCSPWASRATTSPARSSKGIQTWAERKPTLTHEDVKDRAREAIQWEVAQGTGFIRSHVDVCDPNLTALKPLLELRDEVRDIVDLRLIAFPQDGILSFPDGKELMREAMDLAATSSAASHTTNGHVRTAWRRSTSSSTWPRRPGARSTCTATRPTTSRVASWRLSPHARSATGCRAAWWPATSPRSPRYNDAYAFKLIQILKRAGVTMVANPLDNIVLQGRFDTYPKRRGMTRVKELDAAGINVACGHDSIMDPWYPLGRGSMLDALSMLVHVGQMTGRGELFRAYDMVTTNPLRASGRDWALEEGQAGELRGPGRHDEVEAIRLRPSARWVVREGSIVAETEPARSTVFEQGEAIPVSFVRRDEGARGTKEA